MQLYQAQKLNVSIQSCTYYYILAYKAQDLGSERYCLADQHIQAALHANMTMKGGISSALNVFTMANARLIALPGPHLAAFLELAMQCFHSK